MKLIDAGGEAGSPGRLSEDRSGVSGNLAWVIDGASDFRDEKNLPAVSNVHWLVDYVQNSLYARGAVGAAVSGSQLLFEIQADVVKELAGYGLREMQHPCCSLSLLIVHHDYLEIARVGDASGFLYGESIDVEVSTDFFDTREAEAVERARADDLTLDQITSAMYQRRSEYIRGINGESVFSGHPSGNLFVHSLLVPHRGGEYTVLLCTDGLTRAISEYQIIADWHALIDACRTNGIDAVIAEVRAFEANMTGSVRGKFKKSDDIVALLLEV